MLKNESESKVDPVVRIFEVGASGAGGPPCVTSMKSKGEVDIH
jgi:hypothetical protein